MKKTIIKRGILVDPSQHINATMDILIENGTVQKIDKSIEAEDAEIIDAEGMFVFPGIIDMHVHLRDPGLTYKEDILSGGEAAAAGGVTGVAAMPNTVPVIDSIEQIEYIKNKAQKAKTKVYPIASVTVGQDGTKLTDFALLKQAGAVAVSDDGKPVENAEVMKRALELGRDTGVLVISHCEDLDIINGGIINKGAVSEQLGVKGMDRTSEDSITAREIALAMGVNGHIHIAHVSTKGSVEIIRQAKKSGVQVTCETCPQYFTFTHQELLKRDADFRMNPPLREEEDRLAIIQGILDGTIDCIVTDHAPHSPEEKADFEKAPNGVIGMETSLAVAYEELVLKNRLPLYQLIEMMSMRPATLLGVHAGSLKVGMPGDVTIFNPKKEWIVDPDKMHSKSRNAIFKGRKIIGKVQYTLLNGEIVFSEI